MRRLSTQPETWVATEDCSLVAGSHCTRGLQRLDADRLPSGVHVDGNEVPPHVSARYLAVSQFDVRRVNIGVLSKSRLQVRTLARLSPTIPVSAVTPERL